MTRPLVLIAIATAFGLTAMSAEAPAAARKPRASCEAAAALTLVGSAPPEDATVKSLTGAKTVRRVAPGQAVTMEYKPDRVTLEIAKGRVVSTGCG